MKKSEFNNIFKDLPAPVKKSLWKYVSNIENARKEIAKETKKAYKTMEQNYNKWIKKFDMTELLK